MAKILKLGAVLFVITAVTGLVLGGVYTMTLEPINIAKEKEKAEALAQTLPEASEFEGIEIQQGQGVIKEVNRGLANGETVGYNITVTPKGYSGLIEMVVGISKEGKLANIKILSHTETPGLGAKAAEPAFSGQFRDKKTDELTVTKTSPGKDSEIQAISGATITSRAVTSGVNTALKYWKAKWLRSFNNDSIRQLQPDIREKCPTKYNR
mgnify:CR=1 FL=1